MPVQTWLNKRRFFTCRQLDPRLHRVKRHAIEFLCNCAAKLMVLDRMSVFVALEDAVLQKRWAAAWRGVMAVAVLGNTVGLAGTIASAVHYQKAAEAASAASAHYIANSTSDGNIFLSLGQQKRQRGASIFIVQRFSEVAVACCSSLSLCSLLLEPYACAASAPAWRYSMQRRGGRL